VNVMASLRQGSTKGVHGTDRTTVSDGRQVGRNDVEKAQIVLPEGLQFVDFP
jgi:hypothetical protein